MNLEKVVLKSDIHNFEYGDVITFDNDDILETSNPKISDSLIIDQSKAQDHYGKTGIIPVFNFS